MLIRNAHLPGNAPTPYPWMLIYQEDSGKRLSADEIPVDPLIL